MTLRTIVAAVLGVAAATFGVAVALGIASLPSDWSRLGLLISLAVAWILWELLMRVRARAYGATPPPAASPAANRMAIAITILVGLAVVIAVALRWLNV